MTDEVARLTQRLNDLEEKLAWIYAGAASAHLDNLPYIPGMPTHESIVTEKLDAYRKLFSTRESE